MAYKIFIQMRKPRLEELNHLTKIKQVLLEPKLAKTPEFLPYHSLYCYWEFQRGERHWNYKTQHKYHQNEMTMVSTWPAHLHCKSSIRVCVVYGVSLVAQWLRICLPMQGTRVWALVWEDPTCPRANMHVFRNYWACALEPMSHNYWALMLQLLKPTRLEPMLRNKRSHRNEKPTHHS